MTARPQPSTDAAWLGAAEVLAPLFGEAAFELRYSVTGTAAIRVLAHGGPVATHHAERPDPQATWVAAARCGPAAGWLLGTAPPSDELRAREALQRAVDRHTGVGWQRLSERRAAMTANVLERLTHSLRTDVSALHAVTDGALRGLFDPEEREQVSAEVATAANDAQRKLSDVREVMAVLHPESPREPQPLIVLLRRELDAVGADVDVTAVEGEEPMALIPGPGWAAVARLLAAALASDCRLRGTGVRVHPHPEGWTVVAGAHAEATEPAAWDEPTVGDLVHAGNIAIAAGGTAAATRSPDGRLRVQLTVPAAPSPGG